MERTIEVHDMVPEPEEHEIVEEPEEVNFQTYDQKNQYFNGVKVYEPNNYYNDEGKQQFQGT